MREGYGRDGGRAGGTGVKEGWNMGRGGRDRQWDIIWKSRRGRVVNGVPREVPRPKAEGPQA